MLSNVLSFFIIILTVIFLFVDLSIMVYISYLYYLAGLKSRYVETLIFILLVAYVVKFLSVFIFIPVIIYLFKQTYDIFEAINKTSYSSLIDLKNENPLAFALISLSYIIYIFSYGVIYIITNELIKYAPEDISRQLTYIKMIDNTFLILYIIFGVLTVYVYFAEKIYMKTVKEQPEKSDVIN